MNPDSCEPADQHGHAAGSGRFPLELSLWLSPSFPVGAFAFSHALEWAASTGLVHDRESAIEWIKGLLANGAPAVDAIVLSVAWRAAARGDTATLLEANELAIALSGSRERHLETTAQGNAFMTMMRAAWAAEKLKRIRDCLEGEVAYPVAVGMSSSLHGLQLGPTVRTFVAAWVANLASALVRLSVIGQTDGQRVIAALIGSIELLCSRAEHCTLDDIGSSAFVSDIASMAHETLETRLFRT